MNANADVNLRESHYPKFLIDVSHLLLHRNCRTDRITRIFVGRRWHSEQNHRSSAKVLIGHAPMSINNAGYCGLDLIQ